MKWDALKADTYRIYGRFSWSCVVRGFFRDRTYRVLVAMRLCQVAARGGAMGVLLLPCKLLHRITIQRAAMDFFWPTKVGPGLALSHGWGLVVHSGASIGRNVTLFHGVTLGRRDRIARDGSRIIGYPVIEDEVWIGPHAVIVGGVTIGRGSRIGAGAVVTEDVPPFSVVTGNPSVIVKQGCTPDVIHPAPQEWLVTE